MKKEKKFVTENNEEERPIVEKLKHDKWLIDKLLLNESNENYTCKW